MQQVDQNYPGLSEHFFIQEMIREMIGEMVTDVLTETRHRIANAKIETVEDIRDAKTQMVAFSSDMFQKVQELRKFLWDHMYTHYTVNRMRYKAEHIVGDLFDVLLERPSCLPDDWQDKYNLVDNNKNERARVVCDYIAGMTDRFAIVEHARLFDLKEE
jgi:dGTPase